MSQSPLPEPTPDTQATNTVNSSARWILGAMMLIALVAVGVATALRPASTQDVSKTAPEDTTPDGPIRTAGRFEVTGRLVEMPGKFLANDGLYNYAFVLKYDVLTIHRGGDQVESTIYVAHYNPRKTRDEVADEFYPDLGGNLKRFRAGDIHLLALELPWDEHYIGPLVDRYHQVNGKRIYWAIWSNTASHDG